MDKSRRRRIGFATFTGLPDGSPDDRLAVEELERRSVEAVPFVWDAPGTDPSRFDMVVIRSTWDYYLRREEFLEWVEQTARIVPLWNPPELIRWNSHKSYLFDLERQGCQVVPTELVPRGSGTSLGSILGRRGWSAAVVKPAVGAAGDGLLTVGPDDTDAGAVHLRKLTAVGDALVQPYLPAAKSLGERSFLFFNGNFAYAMAYASVLEERARRASKISPDSIGLANAHRVVACLPTPPLYARLDFLPTGDGSWLLGELEVIEPELLLRGDGSAPGMFADAVLSRLP